MDRRLPRPAPSLLSLAMALLFLAVVSVGRCDQLYGTGAGSVSGLFGVWGGQYPYSKDSTTVTYTGAASDEAAVNSFRLGLVDFLTFESPVNDSLIAELDALQLPLVGGGIVAAYNLNTSLGATAVLNLDGATLAAIWAGDVTVWNDSRIVALNPGPVAAGLPNTPITLVLPSASGFGLMDVFTRTLSNFSTDFAAQLSAAGGRLADLPHIQATAIIASNSTAAASQVRGMVGSMTFLTWAQAKSAGLAFASMHNRAGKKVTISTAAVQAAMLDYRANFDSGRLATDIFNGGGDASWPLAYLQFVVLHKSVTTLQCSSTQGLLLFFSWVQLNDYVISLSNAQFFPALVPNLQKHFIDDLETVECAGGARALQTAVLLGLGSPQPLFASWADSYPSASFLVKYYQQTTQAAVNEMTAKDIDFGVTAVGLTPDQYVAMPDVVLFPAVASPLVPAYYLPEFVGKEPLTLSFQIISDIYLAKIAYWNDSSIALLNPNVTLPQQPITVIVQNVSAVNNFLISSALAASVPEFNSTLGVGYQLAYPVLNTTRVVATTANNVPDLIAARPYSFGFWSYYAVLQKRVTQAASLVNTAGRAVAPSKASVASALSDFGASTNFTNLLLGPGLESWPVATVISVMVLRTQMVDCVKAAALADWLYWTQTSALASQVADHFGQTVASTSSVMQKIVFNNLVSLTCEGEPVSSIFGCVEDGVLCSNAGVCENHKCQCDATRQGEFCESPVSSSSGSTDLALPIVLATIIPAIVLLCLLLLLFVALLLFFIRKSRRVDDDWSINFNELELVGLLGTGGFGEVHKAVWKGTEVAVKVMATKDVSKDTERGFRDEVRVMTALRHPNVVLFMAACTKPPRMCIVMELMSLGSLYDLLHNELVPDIPFALTCKMTYQAAKGMHFLHSSGIVHRDLKSLNLLLDNKWNVKVGDFGLTKFKGQMEKNATKDIQGTVQWLAPEVLQEAPGVDYVLADVYSFGVILWETITRDQPYAGMTPAGVAVAVIRDNLRPSIPDDTPRDYAQLIADCWHVDPAMRPTFLEIMNRLGTSSSSLHGSSSSSMSSPSLKITGGSTSTWSLPSKSFSSTSASSSAHSSSVMSEGDAAVAGGGGGPRLHPTSEPAPRGEVVIAFSDITCSATLWEFDPVAMRDATLLHNELVRQRIKAHRGYEVVSFGKDRNSGEGSFCVAFQHVADALEWCMGVQLTLLDAPWPEPLLAHPGAAEEGDDRTLFKGLRVRMGVHVGTPKVTQDPMTRRMEYFGPVVNSAAFLTARAHGGQIILSAAVHEKAKATELGQERKRMVNLGTFDMPDSPHAGKLYELKVRGLEGRFFGGVAEVCDTDTTTGTGTDRSTSTQGTQGGGSVKESSPEWGTIGEDLAYQEDHFLTSANMCRWIINFEDIQLGRQVGMGSYGIVYESKWKGVAVAVKRFIKQKLDERRMLEFRAEMAFLSQLHHPNIVLFIGACVKRPNLCIVTEYVQQGALKDILANHSTKLGYEKKMRLLQSAAMGVNHLHSLSPAIIHRDLKSSNLLVDENWNVKVADFGFARIKEENATMTRCGTPCWTAPEVLRGEKYSEAADVFSFGIVMWEVLTRRQPYAGLNFMAVTLDVLEGRRPPLPHDFPRDFKRLIKQCWHASPDKRPSMGEVLDFFNHQLGAKLNEEPV